MAKRLGDILKSLGLITEDGLRAALARKAELGGGRIGEHLVAVGAIDEDTLLQGLARQRHVPFADATLFDKIDERLARLVPRSKAFHYRVVPVRYLDGQLVLATCESANLERVRELVDALGHKVRLVLAPRRPIEQTIARFYAFDAESFIGRSEPPGPARHRLRGKKRKRGKPVEPELLAAAATQPGVQAIDEVSIASEVVGELPPDSGVFQLTREVLDRVHKIRAAAGEDIDTQVREPRQGGAAPGAEIDDDAATILDTDMAARVRAELGDAVSSDSGQWAGIRTHDRLMLDLPRTQADELRRLDSKPRMVARDEALAAAARAAERVEAARVSTRDPAELPPIEIDLYDDDTVPPVEPSAVSFVRGPMPRSLQAEYAAAIGPVPEGSDLHRAPTFPPGQLPQATAFARVPGKRNRVGGDAEAGGVEAAPPGEPFGAYRLIRKIKTGGMAEVFEATTEGFEGITRTVAIKRVLPNLTDSDEFVTMFIDEAKITVQLNHAAIGQVYELGRVGEDYFIAMEYIHGRDLNAIFADAYEKGLQLPLSLACYVIQQVCDGLDYAHRKADANGHSLGIVHRDVSPANVLCSFEGLVKIIDFGIAKAVSKVSLTRPGLIKGKISYMSPEQMRGQPVDRRSDVFAAGIVLYEMISGRRLFAASSDVETIRNVLKGEVPSIRSLRAEVPEDLAAVVHRTLERDPSRRFQWASEVSQALQKVMVQHDFGNPRAELTAYMQARFQGTPASEEEGR